MSLNNLSPGVYVQERDLSTIAPAVSTSTGALVGYSKRGSTNIRLITNRQQFVEEYGIPDIQSSYFHFTALAFLERGRQLYCKRVTGDNARCGGVDIMKEGEGAHTPLATGAVINDNFPEFSGNSGAVFTVYAKDPGEWSQNVAVTITDVQEMNSTFATSEELDPTEQYTFRLNVWYVDSDGNQNKLESWKVSRQRKVDGNGRQLYLEDRINGFSKYIVVADSTEADTVLPEASDDDTFEDAVAMGGASDGDAVTASNINSGWDDFDNPDNIEIQILMDGGHTPTIDGSNSDVASIQAKIKSIAEIRRDCIAVLSVPQAVGSNVQNTVEYRNVDSNLNTSYAAMYAPWCRINDSYNDKIIFVPPTGYIAGVYAYTDAVANVWDAPAGFDRGTLNVLGLSYTYTQGERDELYSNGINCLQTFRGYGHVVWGQKTLQKKESALNRVNVRRPLLMIEKSLTLMLRSFLFTYNNTEATRFMAKAVVDEYLERLANGGAFQTEGEDDGFLVICDTRNNTPAVIDSNTMKVDVFVKPAKTVEFINLTMTVTKTGVSFTELVSRGTIL